MPLPWCAHVAAQMNRKPAPKPSTPLNLFRMIESVECTVFHVNVTWSRANLSRRGRLLVRRNTGPMTEKRHRPVYGRRIVTGHQGIRILGGARDIEITPDAGRLLFQEVYGLQLAGVK